MTKVKVRYGHWFGKLVYRVSDVFGHRIHAITLFEVVYTAHLRLPKAILREEAAHAAQQKRLGWKFYPIYLWQLVRYGYKNAPLEREAKAAARSGREI